MENLKKIIPQFQDKKILVFGDLMLDEHIWSKVNRISPEAPVPIADVIKIDHVPGGCGNVAGNIIALGGIPYLFGIIGKDSSAKKLRQALKQLKISTKYLVQDAKRPTILKSRIIAGSQHMVRVDREGKSEITTDIIKKALNVIKQVDAVIISDYGKGMVTKEASQAIIKTCKKLKKFVAVDPKGTDYSKYQGASIITPNLKEAAEASKIAINDEKSLMKAGKLLLKTIKTKFILITRGKDGMSLFEQQNTHHIAALPREVFDVSGAGDTVIAALVMALTTGAKMKEAALLANTAASVVVAKVSTAPCFSDELEEALESQESVIRKIKSRQEIEALVKNLRTQDAKIIFTNGCFDLLHLGHVRYLREAKKMGDILIIGLNTDSSVKSLKGSPRPYVSEMERAEILASLECVNYVVLFSELRPDNLLKIIKPDVHVKGGDYNANRLPERKLVESLGGKVMVIPPIKGRSTTNIVERILSKQ